MRTPTLPRMHFATLSAAMGTLAIEAKEVLGYDRLGRVGSGPLGAALRKLEIEPLERRAVDAYKASKEHTGMWTRHRIAWSFHGPAFATFAGAFVCAILASITKATPTMDTWITCVFVCGVATLVLALVGGFIRDSWDLGQRRVTSWERSFLSAFDGSVPAFILNKAVQIKRECPSAEIHVEYLSTRFEQHRSREERRQREADPFLIARLDNESYYIDVWDERDFEAAL